MKEETPKVSVITVTKNLIKDGRTEFFKQCVESVHNQTYKNIEHIIIDGASTDGTLELIKEYNDKSWIKYYSELDEGMCDAMNKGIQRASGEYIAILNSDDFYMDYAIELSVKAIEKENADYSYSITKMVDRDNTDKIVSSYPAVNNFSTFWFSIPFNHESMLCKKNVYEKLNYYEYKKYDTISDYHFIMKLIINDYKGVFVDEPILKFRMDGTTNITKKAGESNSYKKHIKMLFKLYKDFWGEFIDTGNMKKINKLLIKKESKAYLSYENIMYLHQSFFTEKLKQYLINKELKNFSYNDFYQYISVVNMVTHKIFLFNFIPFCAIKKYSNNKKIDLKYYLFNFIPLLSTEEESNKKIIKLFNFIPLLSIKEKSKKKIIKLFNFIPLLKIKLS